jgi:hypothetical protein
VPDRSRLLSPELVVVAALVAVALLLAMPPLVGIRIAVVLVVASFGIGTIAGIGYHVVLHRTLAPLPPRWWWSPTSLHARLDPGQRRRVIPWFVVGAAGFVGSLLGCAAFLSAVLRL